MCRVEKDVLETKVHFKGFVLFTYLVIIIYFKDDYYINYNLSRCNAFTILK